MDIISLDNVTKSFGKKRVLNKISFSIKKGELFGIVGPSGSGKSVLIKIIIGFLRPSSGRLYSNDRMGFSMQNNALYENLTLKENLHYFANLYSVKDKKQIIEELLQRLSLTDYQKTLVKNLSGGTKKRADIACALLNNPRVLILDEPFAGLDSVLTSQLMAFFKELNKAGTTIIISSHLLDKIDKLCNRFATIEQGQLVPLNRSKLRKLRA